MAHRKPRIRPPVSFAREPKKSFADATNDLFVTIAEMQADLQKHPPSPPARRAAAILAAHRPKAKARRAQPGLMGPIPGKGQRGLLG